MCILKEMILLLNLLLWDLTDLMNKAKANSAKLLVLNLKNKLDEKRGKTGRN